MTLVRLSERARVALSLARDEQYASCSPFFGIVASRRYSEMAVASTHRLQSHGKAPTRLHIGTSFVGRGWHRWAISAITRPLPWRAGPTAPFA